MISFDYFQAYESYFWRWEEEGDVIAIPESSTIAYRAFVIEVLAHLAAQGIPPFGSMLLAIIATNENGETDLDTVFALMQVKQELRLKVNREPLVSAIRFLKMLAQIPVKYKEGRNRLLLFQTLFANCHNIHAAGKSKKIVELIKLAPKNFGWFSNVKPFHLNSYHNEFRIIGLLANKFPDVHSIVSALASLPTIDEIVLDDNNVPAAPGNDFLAELIENEKTFHIGSLIKRLWSGLNIPFHNMLPSHQPIGGVSDLTNKGELGQLLISEFANDELLFLSRLANNEALYYNREMPPHNNNLERIILIDVSVKSWGEPKAIAFAVMLAIARHPKTDIHCSAFVVGNALHPISFNTIDEIIESLQVLEPCLHPAAGLETFFNTYHQHKKMEVFFISSDESLRQPALQKTISDHYASFNYWMYIGRGGTIDVYKRQQTSKKHIQQLTLPVTEIWQKTHKTKLAGSVIGSKVVYPILFTPPANPRKLLTSPDGELFLITSLRNLFHAIGKDSKADRGWEMVYENLPSFNGEAEMGVLDNGRYILLLFNTQNRELRLLNVSTGNQLAYIFPEWKGSVHRQFMFYKGIFHYFPHSGNAFWTFEWTNEKLIKRTFEQIPNELRDKFLERQEMVKASAVLQNINGGILKNVTKVFINAGDNLVFSIHELSLSMGRDIRMEHSGFIRKHYSAKETHKDTFTFSEGSKVTINRAGLIVLTSSDAAIEPIFIPSVLNASLGMATATTFAGSGYYLPPTENIKVISVTEFWKLHLERFIENIKRNGTKDTSIS